MATYVEKFGGYIADVPRVVFSRCDRRRFYFDELTAATVTPNIETTDIQAGWSLFPVAVLPGASSFEMQITSGKFDPEIFSMANATAYKVNDTYAMPTAERQTVDANHKVTLLKTPIADSVSIAGMKEGASATEATETEPAQFAVNLETKEITLPESVAANTEVEIIYDYAREAHEAIVDNKSSAIGEAACIWPVYGSGDDCSESSIIGYYVVKVFRARITQAPGMDTSYKSAATFQFTLTALDAKRNDQGAYSTAYFKGEL